MKTLITAAKETRIGYTNQRVCVFNRVSFFTTLTNWLKILSRLRKTGISTQKIKKNSNHQSFNLRNLASTMSIDGYCKTLLDIFNCQKSGFGRKWLV